MHQFIQRRARLIEHMRSNGGGVAIVPTARELLRNGDVEYAFRHDSNFYYLTGFVEPDAVLVLVVDASRDGRAQSLLFCREKDVEHEIWHGFRHGPEGARDSFGFDAAFPVAELAQRVPSLLAGASAVYGCPGQDGEWDAQLASWLNAVRRQARSGVRAPAAIVDVRQLLGEMRVVKDDSELASMRRAAQISAEAQLRAMRCARPGMTEYQIEAELLYEFRRSGADAPAYPAIVAAGANACVLHHNPGAAVLKAGDLLLIDAGCEYQSYASDITRTFPVTGRYSGAQRTMYELVLAAQMAAIAAVKPGNRFSDPHDAAVRLLAQGMLDTGLLDRNKVGAVDDVVGNGDYRRFFMCRTTHWLGLDVHDAGDYGEATASVADRPSRLLRPGMTLTVEPGLYIRPAPDVPEQYWHIGIRIEDDVLVAGGACEVLSHGVPKTIAEIEAVMTR
ncbi:aminopeptidase P N-terminal domain-containing protein [Duganella sp. HH105]|uniref:aminopeptidase P N-terminal domain-containing protein n=1 Tax=Duganella sp. HH105 TaxID=1781067 RepID=UPI000877DC87|nr:aminopeptidase P N-terminal domain-containing protein [Duganella sp. HH105]OEZ56927.1 Xaa-Pro aminopeptidase [Duganella sp. HH105]